MLTLLWLKGLLSHRPGRLLGAIVGVALTVALLASISTFTIASAATMTQRAIAGIPVDWQIQLAPGTNLKTVVDLLGQSTPYTALQPIGYAESTGFSATTNGTAQTTGAGKVLGISPEYRQKFAAEFRSLIGSLDGVMVAQQTAANLQIALGDTVTIQRPGLSPAQVKINGVIDLPYADSLFQAIGTPPGIAPQAPPDNVLLLPLEQWHQLFDPQAIVSPDSVHTQLHVRIAHNLPADPGKAYIEVQQRASNLEARIAGRGMIGDNLAAKLDSTRAEALYARVLFLFLGLPGVILAVLLTLAVAATGNDRRQQEQALLRTRGADTAKILQLASVESLVVGIGGMGLGLGLAILTTFSLASVATLTRLDTWIWMVIAAIVGLGLAIVAVLVPAWRTARSTTVTSARAILGNQRKPLWRLIWLDVFLLTLSAVMFWRSASTGYQVVVAPEGVPQTSVSYELFIAPVCLWLGAALLTLRLAEVGLMRGRSFLSNVLQVPLGSLASVIIAALSRQRLRVTSGIGLVALAFSFAISTAVFNTTYNAQSRVDAELTNGADIQIVLPPGSSGIPVALQEELKTLPGVVGLQPMQHRFAYVGRDLQDLYGINPVTLPEATHLANAYFASHNAAATMKNLATRPDGILVSEETVRDFQLQPGDLINLRLQSAEDGQYHVVPFHLVDVVKEFPTAPTDSFLVANAEYIAKQTRNNATETVLIRAKDNMSQLTSEVNQLANHLPGAKVTDLNSAQRTISSSLTAVDLHGLTRLELSFAILLLAGATGLILALGMAERRRTFAILSAIGATSHQLGAFLWTEGLVILVAGGAIGSLIGFAVAEMLVKVLTGVFDPPPEVLSIPWSYIMVLLIAAFASTVIAVVGAQVSVQRVGVEVLRDL